MRYNIKHLYNIQIQKYIANKKIIQNYAQMKYKWPVTAIKPMKIKLFSVTSNLFTVARLNQTRFKKYFPVSLFTVCNIKREDIMLEILYSSTIKR